ncbi:polyprenyl synthetase family protein [Alteromonas sp. MB-3u-76]|jgi:geranylgeranyl diphosphate synthase type II|uniref:polyprenyl synthetase family protein n=1 Tax=Alteromonas sp. MB-3u-76 TaxID=2058133 RepID=UPI0012FDBC9B|nr:polyprenyl synthetase family protein [Alteromonas sp. MB-3u-76]
MNKSKVKSTSKINTRMMEALEKALFLSVSENTAACYHLQSGGSRTRAKLCLDASNALMLNEKMALSLSCCVELLHNASLVHDDLQDNDAERRGRASVWSRFGKDIALCAGDLMLSKAYGALSGIDEINKLPALLRCVSNSVSKTIEGQCKDIHQQCKSLSDFELIAAEKSGPLLQLSLALPLIAANYESEVERASEAIRQFAIAYQIADDMNDWRADLANGQLNIVNLLARESDHSQAIELSKTRAQYLLKRCELELKELPANCGASAIEACQQLFKAVCRSQNE